MTSGPHYDEPVLSPRTSGLAVASLVFGLLCCIPGSGLIGVVLGGAGLVRIGRSEGRLAGRGMALVGIVLGLLGTLFYLGGTVGVMGLLNSFNVYGDVAKALDKGDHGTVRAMLSPSTAGSLSDEQLDRFAQHIRDEWGAFKGLPKGLPDWIASYQSVAEVIGRAQGGAAPQLPLPLHYERGTPAGIFLLEPGSTGPGGAATISNLGVFARDGSLIWLLDRGPPSAAPAPGPSGPAGGPGGGGPGR